MTRANVLSFFFSLVLYAVLATPTHAASLYIDPNSLTLLKGDTASVAVRVDTDEDECINTVDAVISYSPGVQAIDVSRGRSILTLWVEEPTIDQDASRVTFAGGIPNGYCGRIPGDPNLTNIVAEIVFRAPGFSVGTQDTTQSLVHFEPETQVLLNDGTGDRAPLRLLDGTIELVQAVGTTTKDEWRTTVNADETQPSPFSIELTRQDGVFGGKYFIAFNTTDKQSGIDHYEVLEESRDDLFTFRFARTDAPWATVESPYVLTDQNLKSIIRVKAVDKAGNERTATLIPDDSLRPVDILMYVVIGVAAVFGLIILGALVWLFLRWKRTMRRTLHTNNDVVMKHDDE